jgi:hypothetical protein
VDVERAVDLYAQGRSLRQIGAKHAERGDLRLKIKLMKDLFVIYLVEFLILLYNLGYERSTNSSRSASFIWKKS